MSTDFNINLTQLNEKGLVEEIDSCVMQYDDDYTGAVSYAYTVTSVKFVGYEYYRECDIDNNELHISCSGSFRVWLRDFLTLNYIEFEEF